MEHVFSSKTIHIKPQSAVQPIVFAIFIVEMDLTLQLGAHGVQERPLSGFCYLTDLVREVRIRYSSHLTSNSPAPLEKQGGGLKIWNADKQ